MKRATIIAITTMVIILAVIGITRTTTPAQAVSGTTRAYAVMIHNQTAEEEMTAAYSWEPDATQASGWRITDRSMIWTSNPARTGDRLSMSISAVKNGGNTVLHAVRVSGLTAPVITTGNVAGTYGGGTVVITLNDGGTLTLTPSASTVHLIVKEGK